jgi:hypothetical protein
MKDLATLNPIHMDDIDFNLWQRVPIGILAKLKSKVPYGVLMKRGLLCDQEINSHLGSVLAGTFNGLSTEEIRYWNGYIDGALEVANG